MNQTDQTPDRPCEYHPGVPSLTTCAECRADICGACHASDERGYALCPACREVTPGRTPAWTRDDTRYSPTAFATTLFRLVRHPRSFYESLPDRGPWLPPLLFGTTTLVIGLFAAQAWTLVLEIDSLSALAPIAEQDALSDSEASWATLASTPVLAAMAVGAHLAAMKAAVSAAGADLAWGRLARIVGYALGASVFLLLPPVQGFKIGHFLAVLWIFNLEANALETYADFGPWSSTATVAFPILLLMICSA